MSFLWPELLWLLGLVPVAIVVYTMLLRRRKQAALRYASLNVAGGANAAVSAWRRLLPPVLFVLALTLLLVAVARPAAVVTLPSRHDTVILAMDVSGSMRAADVKPTRLAAAQDAARTFVARQPKSTRLGIVSFAATASVVQTPTHDREQILAAIERFQLQRGTAVGSGILVSLKMVVPDVEFDLRSANPRPKPAPKAASDAKGAAAKDGAPAEPPKPVAPGSHTGAAIVLLTDGQTTAGPDPIEAARIAGERGVRVYTVGIGTPAGETILAEGWSMRVRLDETSLKSIANLTGAEYFYAGTAADLQKVYEKLDTKIFFEQRQMEVTALVAAAAALVAFASAALSLAWFNRIL